MATTYTITNIVPRVRSGPGNTFTKVQEVTFVTVPSKLTGQVDVPDDMFTPENVDALVTAHAATLEAVKVL